MRARRVRKLEPREPLADNAARIVRVRLDELRSFAPRAFESGAVRAQHDMRIAAKRLRYVLETTEFCFGRPAEVARRRARDLQDILGELHDCDVMLPRVERHLAGLRQADAAAVRERAGNASDLEPALAARAPHRTSYRGLEILIVYVHARRALLFDRFRGLERRLQEARERRRAAKRAEKARRELEAAEQQEREAASRAAEAAAELQAARQATRGDAAGRRDVSRPTDGR